MLIAHVTFAVAETERQAALATLVAEAETVRAMPGCIAFTPFADPTDSQKVGIVHEWETAEQFRAYAQSPSFAASGQMLRPMMVDKPLSRRFAAELIESVN
jgi:quinol monooxygenase YgiN